MMPQPANIGPNAECPPLLIRSLELALPANAKNRAPVGTTLALASAQNRPIVDLSFRGDQSSDKYREIRLRVNRRAVRADVQNTWTECVTTGVRVDARADTLRVNLIARYPIQINTQDALYSCGETDVSLLQESISGAMNAVLQEINARAILFLEAQAGQYRDGSATKAYTVLNTTPVGPNQLAFSRMRRELINIENSGPMMLIGDGSLYDSVLGIGIGCCNNAGQMIDQIATEKYANMVFYHDPQIQEVVPAPVERGYILGLQNVVMLETFDHRAMTVGPGEISQVYVDEVTGIAFDIRFWRDVNCNRWLGYVQKWYDFYIMQGTTKFKASDYLVNTNGVLRGTFV